MSVCLQPNTLDKKNRAGRSLHNTLKPKKECVDKKTKFTPKQLDLFIIISKFPNAITEQVF